MTEKAIIPTTVLGTPLNRFTLEFRDPRIENEFTAYYCYKYIWQLRFAHLIAIGLYLFAVVAEKFLLEIPLPLLIIHVSIVIPSFLLGFLFTFVHKTLYFKNLQVH